MVYNIYGPTHLFMRMRTKYVPYWYGSGIALKCTTSIYIRNTLKMNKLGCGDHIIVLWQLETSDGLVK